VRKDIGLMMKGRHAYHVKQENIVILIEGRRARDADLGKK
jgi:hypothetical protein